MYPSYRAQHNRYKSNNNVLRVFFVFYFLFMCPNCVSTKMTQQEYDQPACSLLIICWWSEDVLLSSCRVPISLDILFEEYFRACLLGVSVKWTPFHRMFIGSKRSSKNLVWDRILKNLILHKSELGNILKRKTQSLYVHPYCISIPTSYIMETNSIPIFSSMSLWSHYERIRERFIYKMRYTMDIMSRTIIYNWFSNYIFFSHWKSTMYYSKIILKYLKWYFFVAIKINCMFWMSEDYVCDQL